MTQIWYELKKLGYMEMNKNCNLCREALKELKNKKPLKGNEAIVIVPDVNCFGITTHYHISKTGWDREKRITFNKEIKNEP